MKAENLWLRSIVPQLLRTACREESEVRGCPDPGCKRERSALERDNGAVPRFYFHLLNDIDAPDGEGIELPDLDAARQCAERSLRFTAAETLRETSKVVLSHRILIENADGTVLHTVLLRDVVKVEG